jgi:phospholipase C
VAGASCRYRCGCTSVFARTGWRAPGHPGSGKASLLEDFIQNIVDRTKANPKLFAETAIIVSFDESGDLYDMFDLSIASIVKNEINNVKDEIRDIRKGN